MSDSDFERQGMAVLASIESQLEALMQTTSVQWDSALEGTVLRLTFDDDSRIVINLQAPLREIWLAYADQGLCVESVPLQDIAAR
ncbi:MAG: hypothetical protein EB114_13720, partial [Betaproteobacteria bacterium]|nr:hypothetical protein [Betaproteobacteria bacterium]